MNVLELCQAAKKASKTLALAESHEKIKALHAMAKAIREQTESILDANKKDLLAAEQKNSASSFLDRLKLDEKRIESMAEALDKIADLPDPIGKVLDKFYPPNGLEINRVRVPIGVIAVIYESRPNVTADAAGLCLKSGNAVILRGGSESFHSSQAIMQALQSGIKKTSIPSNVIQMIPTPERSAVDEMLLMNEYIDVIIPRGGMQLIDYVSEHTRIPIFKHLAGLCHTYLHKAADKEMANQVVLNAKMRRTGICGATEILLVDQEILHTHLPNLLENLIQSGCEIRGDTEIQQLNSRVKPVSDDDYNTEFLDAIIAIKVVKNISEAIQHINLHGTQHTDAIITQDSAAAEQFLQEVDSAIVMHNTSTQFADGGEFGMGAEIGIATGKLHARGPIGVEQLTIFKYIVRGKGQIRPL